MYTHKLILLLKWCFLFATEKESGESEAVEGAARKTEGLVRMLDVEVTSKLMPPKILGIFGWPPKELFKRGYTQWLPIIKVYGVDY